MGPDNNPCRCFACPVTLEREFKLEWGFLPGVQQFEISVFPLAFGAVLSKDRLSGFYEK